MILHDSAPQRTRRQSKKRNPLKDERSLNYDIASCWKLGFTLLLYFLCTRSAALCANWLPDTSKCSRLWFLSGKLKVKLLLGLGNTVRKCPHPQNELGNIPQKGIGAQQSSR